MNGTKLNLNAQPFLPRSHQSFDLTNISEENFQRNISFHFPTPQHYLNPSFRFHNDIYLDQTEADLPTDKDTYELNSNILINYYRCFYR